jgi:hypothetical protein
MGNASTAVIRCQIGKLPVVTRLLSLKLPLSANTITFRCYYHSINDFTSHISIYRISIDSNH